MLESERFIEKKIISIFSLRFLWDSSLIYQKYISGIVLIKCWIGSELPEKICLNIMKHILRGLCVVAIVGMVTFAKKPNIILLIMDDQVNDLAGHALRQTIKFYYGEFLSFFLWKRAYYLTRVLSDLKQTCHKVWVN